MGADEVLIIRERVMSKWETIKLGDILKIKHGFAFKGEFFSDLPTNNILVTPGNFNIGGGFKDSKFKYYSGEFPEEYILAANNVIVTMTDLSKAGDTLGYSAKVPAMAGKNLLHNQRIGLLQFNNDQVSQDFIYWLLRTKKYQSFILGSATGSTVKHTSPSRISEFEFELPPLQEQQRIADILSAFDDKIALNREMNKTFEAMAQAIFKSWFVDFEPFRDGEFVESELGMIPKGWEVKPLPELIELNPRYSLKKGSEASYLDMANIPTDNARVNEVVIREFSSGSKFMNGDTLLARITPSLENGKTAFVDFLEEDEIGWGSTEFIVMRAKNPLPKEFTYFLARTDDFRNFAISNMSGTSGRQRVPNDCFEQYLMILPDVDTCKKFGEFASSVIKKMQGNDLESKTLSNLRDSFLPKLLSGEIEV